MCCMRTWRSTSNTELSRLSPPPRSPLCCYVPVRSGRSVLLNNNYCFDTSASSSKKNGQGGNARNLFDSFFHNNHKIFRSNRSNRSNALVWWTLGSNSRLTTHGLSTTPFVKALVRWATGKGISNRLPKLSITTSVHDPSGPGRVDMLTTPVVAAARAVVTTGAWVKSKRYIYLIRGSVGA